MKGRKREGLMEVSQATVPTTEGSAKPGDAFVLKSATQEPPLGRVCLRVSAAHVADLGAVSGRLAFSSTNGFSSSTPGPLCMVLPVTGRWRGRASCHSVHTTSPRIVSLLKSFRSFFSGKQIHRIEEMKGQKTLVAFKRTL